MKLPLIIGSVFALSASTALAGNAADAFAKLDTDNSGGVSMDELRFDTLISQEDFAAYDDNASGELEKTEFAAWSEMKPESDEPIVEEPDIAEPDIDAMQLEQPDSE